MQTKLFAQLNAQIARTMHTPCICHYSILKSAYTAYNTDLTHVSNINKEPLKLQMAMIYLKYQHLYSFASAIIYILAPFIQI